MYDANVLIVGAGPTGLTLALDLARRGIAFRLIEAAAAPFEGSRGKGIQPRTLEIFDNLGVISEIVEAGGLYPKFRTHLGAISLCAGSLGPERKATETVPYPNLWMVPQARTEAILRGRLHQVGSEVEFGKSLVKFDQNEDAVEATLATGETLTAQFLIGCDGGHSTVRKLLGLSLVGEALGEQPMVVADIEVEGLDRRNWHIWPLAKGGVMGLCPLPNTPLFQFTARETRSPCIEERIQLATGYRVQHVAWNSIYRPAVRMVQRYRVGRVLLAGDAAHVHPPTGGQGLNTGIQDAYNLGWKLASVIHGAADSLLDTYEEERRPIAAAVLGLSKRLYQTPTIKRGDATNQLSLHYRTSSLSSGRVVGSLHPGDRVPDAQMGDGGGLFEKLRGGRATQIFTKDGIGILIRPDGYIANIGHERFTQYWGENVQQLDGIGKTLAGGLNFL